MKYMVLSENKDPNVEIYLGASLNKKAIKDFTSAYSIKYREYPYNRRCVDTESCKAAMNADGVVNDAIKEKVIGLMSDPAARRQDLAGAVFGDD